MPLLTSRPANRFVSTLTPPLGTARRPPWRCIGQTDARGCNSRPSSFFSTSRTSHPPSLLRACTFSSIPCRDEQGKRRRSLSISRRSCNSSSQLTGVPEASKRRIVSCCYMSLSDARSCIGVFDKLRQQVDTPSASTWLLLLREDTDGMRSTRCAARNRPLSHTLARSNTLDPKRLSPCDQSSWTMLTRSGSVAGV